MSLTKEQERNLAKTFLEAIVIFYEKEGDNLKGISETRKFQIRSFCFQYPYFVWYLESATQLSSQLYVSSAWTSLDVFQSSAVEEAAMLRITYREYINEIESSAKEFGDSVEHILELMKNGDPNDELDNFYSILDKKHKGGYLEWYTGTYNARE